MNTVTQHLEKAINAAKQARDEAYSLLKQQEIGQEDPFIEVMGLITDAIAKLNHAKVKELPSTLKPEQERNPRGELPPEGYRWMKYGEVVQQGDGYIEGGFTPYKHTIGRTVGKTDLNDALRPLK